MVLDARDPALDGGPNNRLKETSLMTEAAQVLVLKSLQKVSAILCNPSLFLHLFILLGYIDIFITFGVIFAWRDVFKLPKSSGTTFPGEIRTMFQSCYDIVPKARGSFIS